MITYQEALQLVLENSIDFGVENVNITDCIGRVLAEDIIADRDFPPFDRVTKDGIAFKFDQFSQEKEFKLEGIAAAGSPQKKLANPNNCIEVMTGAMLPKNTDTVVMYEQLDIQNEHAKVLSTPSRGQNIHYKGDDQKKDNILISSNKKVTSNNIGILATVGKSELKVKSLPKVAVISTGNELVEISEIPELHQIRSSNSLSLSSLLEKEKIKNERFHIPDDKTEIKNKLGVLLDKFDVIMLSGGVSMGKFDFLPDILNEIGVTKIFHKVAQRPGKPFWFGVHSQSSTTIFSFPGNPNSTYVNYHLYFLPWLKESIGIKTEKMFVITSQKIEGLKGLDHFPMVTIRNQKGRLISTKIANNGSGDMVSLSQADGLIHLVKDQIVKKGDSLMFIPF